MKFKSLSLLALFCVIGFVSCKKDDVSQIVIEERDRDVQQEADMDSLQVYLNTHYYNKAEIDAVLPNVGINDINIIEIDTTKQSVPQGYELLKTAVGDSIYASYAGTDYYYYVLNLNQGGGANSPTFADDIRAFYEVSTIDDVIRDTNTIIPIDFDLVEEVAIEGWRRVFPSFNTAESFTDNGDGTVSYNNTGLGIMFLPSGLGYFSSYNGSIPAYSPLIFKFELLQMAENDHDGDGIPSYLEDINQNNILSDNTDEDTYLSGYYTYPLYNYMDSDDDGDGVLTKNEIETKTINKSTLAEFDILRDELEGTNQVLLNYIKRETNNTYTGTIITLFDDNDDGTPDYLDSEISTDHSL